MIRHLFDAMASWRRKSTHACQVSEYEMNDFSQYAQYFNREIFHLHVWAAIVSLLWIQILECIAIFSERYERIVCIQEKHYWVVTWYKVQISWCVLTFWLYWFLLPTSFFYHIFTMRHCIFYVSIHALTRWLNTHHKQTITSAYCKIIAWRAVQHVIMAFPLLTIFISLRMFIGCIVPSQVFY